MKPGILVVAIPQRGSLASAYELLTAGRALADSLKEPLAAVLLGKGVSTSAQDLVERGADKVFVFDHPSLEGFNDELHGRAVAELARSEGFGKLLLAASVAGRSLAARVAVKLSAGLASDVSQFSAEGGALKARRSTYSGNVLADMTFKSEVAVLTLQAMAWPPAARSSARHGEVQTAAFDPASTPCGTEFVSSQAPESGEVDLASAERIVSGGRGLGSAEGFKIIRDLAHAIGAAVGASRAVVDSGWIPYRHQVGLTGRAVRPKLYVACGISGQIQHLAGMSGSKTIVAINTDGDCPMMKLATISVAADLHELIPLIVQEIRKRKGAAVAA